MTELSTEAASQPKPAFWYGIPHGYLPLDLDPPVEQVEALMHQVLSLPDEQRDRAEKVFRFYAGVISSLNANNVKGAALGLHPDGAGGFTFSALTISTIPSSGVNTKLVIASLAGSASDDPDVGMRPLELPCGLGFLAEEKRRQVAPGRPPEESGALLEEMVWQGTVAVTGSGTADIILIQLVTSGVEQADDYRNVLLGVAHTVTFTDPALPGASDEAAEADPGSATATVWNDFG